MKRRGWGADEKEITRKGRREERPEEKAAMGYSGGLVKQLQNSQDGKGEHCKEEPGLAELLSVGTRPLS